MPVSDKMKTTLRRTMGGQNTGDAPFNAASQGGYRNMAKQIAGGAKMSPRGMATAQQGVATPARQAPLTANDMTQAAAGQALQRLGAGPAATDMMGQRGMGGGLGAVDTSMARGLSDVGGGLQGLGLGQRAATPTTAMTGKVGGFAGQITSPTLGQGPQYTGPADSNYGLPGYGDYVPGSATSASAGEPINVDRGASGFTGQASPQSTEAMVEGAIRDLLMGGIRDTTAEENLAREMIQAQQQQALVDQRARAGRAGLVQTGAQAGIESDIRQRAAQAALRDIMGIQSEARGEQRADVGLAGQLYGMDKAIAAEEARTAALLQALQAMYGQGDDTPTYGPGSPGWFNQSPIRDSETVASPYGTPLDAPPEGGRLLGEVEYNGVVYDEYLGTDGTSYLVNKTSSTPTAASAGNRRPFPRG